jgi:O-antigen/teichoic acid export membrane protein
MSNANPGNVPLSTQVSRAVVWNTIFVPLRLLAEVLATLVKLNLLSQAGYGLLALIGGANNGLGTAVDMGTQRALPKYIPEVNRSGGPAAVLRFLTAIFAAQMGLLLVIGIGLSSLFREGYLNRLRDSIMQDPSLAALDRSQLLGLLNGYGWLVIGAILALLFLGVCYDMLMAYLNSFFKQRAWNSITLVAGLLPQLLSVAAIVLLADEWDILGVLGATVLAPTIAVALAGWQVLRLWREGVGQATDVANSPADGLPSRGLIDWLRSALPPGFLRYSAVSFLMTATDFIASASFAIYLAGGISDAALLAAGAALARMALSYLYTPMVGVQVPLFTRVRQGEGGTLNGAYQSLVRLQLLLLIPGGTGLMLLAEPALLVISPQYLNAAPVVWALVPCLFAECLLTTAHNALIVYERLPIIVISRLLTLAVVAPLAWLLPGWLGLLGVALAFGLARVVAGTWATASGARLLGLRWPWRFTLRVSLATVAMAGLILAIRGWLPPLPETADLVTRLREALLLLGMAGIGAAGFFAALRLLGGIDPADRAQVEKLRLPLKRWILRLL